MATADEWHEWDYHLQKHKEILQNIKGTVDQKRPFGANPVVRRAQENTRKFYDDLKKAEIGRANKKIVEKLNYISKGAQAYDPRAPPPARMLAAGPSKAAQSEAPGRSKSQSLQSANRIWMVEQDNVSLVRRILSMKSIFDGNGKELQEFQRHQRDVQMLQKLPNGPKKTVPAPRNLPPLRPPRPSNLGAVTLHGLDMLFLPGDLKRSASGTMEGERALSASAPLFSSPAEADDQESPKKGLSSGNLGATIKAERQTATPAQKPSTPAKKLGTPVKPATPGKAATTGKPSTPGEPAKLGGAANPSKQVEEQVEEQVEAPREGEGQWSHVDQETERRSWRAPEPSVGEQLPILEGEQKAAEKTEAAGPVAGISMLTGMSVDSELKYADEWDEFSMTSAASSPYRSRVGLMDSSATNQPAFEGSKIIDSAADGRGTTTTKDPVETSTAGDPAAQAVTSSPEVAAVAEAPKKAGRRPR